MARKDKDYFFDFPATTNGTGFNTKNRPTKERFQELFDSLLFPEETDDAATTTEVGLMRLATPNEVQARTYTGSFPAVATVSQLTDIIAVTTGHVWVEDITVNGILAGKWGDSTKNKIDYKLGVNRRYSVVISSDYIQLSGDEDAPGPTKYYGTDGTGAKGFHALTIPSTPIAPLVNTNGVITINPSFVNPATLINFAAVPLNCGDITLSATTTAYIKSNKPIVINPSGEQHEVFIYGGNAAIAQPGGGVFIRGGIGTSSLYGPVIIASDDEGNAQGRVGIGTIADATDILNVGGTTQTELLKVTEAIEGAVGDFNTAGKIACLTDSHELKWMTYASLMTKMPAGVFNITSGNVIQPSNPVTAINIGSAYLQCGYIKMTTDLSTGDENSKILCINSSGVVEELTLQELKDELDALATP